MTRRLQTLAVRRELLVAQSQLLRMEIALHAAKTRDALRPASLLGGAIAQPIAVVALVEAVAPLFGLRRLARWVRIAWIAFAVFRIAMSWRAGERTEAS
jgi:hypothetical protein